ncbi:MAG: hypothetical protein A3G18_00225 [Rhodospirillales bacterium RIFCSPLOWO2_12_FULL_58_28]|nr:MAG: hypothetical protein A3H92_02835 [Rhodospirillales bacterium RIFCSPLOWO2_02_FULL_58_16]OHC79894.1 MAG: hypothetical protein A3G18_00225 [Rhodospirillales bacterium RIFCSPLOWO2_12_FULL_58_28]
MNNSKPVFLGLLGVVSLLAGGVTYAITGEFSAVPLLLVWGGLLLTMVSLYVNFAGVRGLIARRSTKFGANMLLMIGIFAVIIGMIGATSMRYKYRIDLTATKRYSLSPQTVKILKTLERDVDAIAFYRSDERTRQAMNDLLQEYSYHSPKFKYWFVDPDKRPVETAKYGVTSYRTTLIRSGDREEIVGFESEEKVTNSLLRVLKDEVKTIYFVNGHGEHPLDDAEKPGYKTAKEALEKDNFKVKDLLLVGEGAVPEDAAVVVVGGPKKDFLEGELKKLADYIGKGGKALFMLDPSPTPVLAKYLADYGFVVGNDIVIDKRGQMIGANYLTPVVTEYHKDHPLGRDFSVATFYPVSRSVEITEDPTKGSYNLAKTGANSWSMTEGKLNEDDIKFNPALDRRGPINIVSVTTVKVEGEESKPPVDSAADETAGMDETTRKALKGSQEEGLSSWGKIVVVGDSDFVGNAHIGLMGNKDYFLNMISWLAEETSLISVRRKTVGVTPMPLSDTQSKLVFWLSVVIAPSLILAVGGAVVARRRWAA